MRSARLDATDWRILHALQADGRITNVDLARKVGISAPACLRRARALEDAGIIMGFTALLNDKALGFEVTAFAMIRLHSQAEGDLVAFEERARSSLHALGRDRFHAPLRGARFDRIPGFHHSRSDGRAERCERQDLARHSRLKACRGRAGRACRRGKRPAGARGPRALSDASRRVHERFQ